MSKSKKSNETLTFEEALKQLESLVEKLEEGEIPLGESVASFEEGMRLLKLCREQLEAAETTIKQLVEKDQEFQLLDAPLDEDSEDWA